MDFETAIEALNRSECLETHSTDKLLEFACGTRILYLSRKGQRVHLIAEPGIADQLRDVFCTRLGDLADYFNSNLKEFSRRLNRGSKPERHGTSWSNSLSQNRRYRMAFTPTPKSAWA
jgi:hypothetical protein